MDVAFNNTTFAAAANKTRCVLGEDPFADAKLFNFFLELVIAVFGLASNSVVIAVNRRIKAPTSTDVYIMFLAITDILVILSVSLFAYRYAYRYLFPETVSWYYTTLMALIGLLFKTFTQCLNTYTIVMLNVDRYILVKFFTTLAKHVCTPRRATIHFIIAIICSAIFAVPRVVEHVPMIVDQEKYLVQCEGYYKAIGGIGIEYVYQMSYRVVLYVIVMYVVPLTLLAVTNVTLISVVRRRRKWLNDMLSNASKITAEKEKKKRQEINTVITLLAVTIIFMACQVFSLVFSDEPRAQVQNSPFNLLFQIPDMVLQFIWKLSPKHGPIANMFTYQIVIINSSINFIVYAVSSSVFRRRLREVCGSAGSVELSNS